LNSFKSGNCNILIATDVASRGLDIPNVDLVIQMSPPFEVESYIHRSGRTARAGNDGKCITMFSRSENFAIRQIAQKAGVNFLKSTLPKAEELVELSIKNLDERIGDVDEEVLEMFKKSATRLIMNKGALNAVSTVLAHLSGAHKSTAKVSLMTGEEGHTTLTISTERGIYSKGYVADIIRRVLPQEGDINFDRVAIGADGRCALFDIPTSQLKMFMENYKADVGSEGNNYYSVEVTDSLPELQDNKRRGNRGNGSYRNNDRRGSRFVSNSFLPIIEF